MKTLEQYLSENLEKNIIDFRLRAQTDLDGKVIFYIHPDGIDGETPSFRAISDRCFPIGGKPYVILNGDLEEFEGSEGAIPCCVVRSRLPAEIAGRPIFFLPPPESHRVFGNPIKDSDLVPSGSSLVSIPEAHV